MRSGSEITVALEAFVDRWRGYDGTERAGAQTFLNELFACYGTDPRAVGATFEHFAASSGFMDVDPALRESVAAAARDLYALRSELCVEHDLGLTKLYNLMDDGAFTDLAAAHRRLDEAVVAAYGWPTSIAQDGDELVRRLTERNRQITEGEIPYAPFD